MSAEPTPEQSGPADQQTKMDSKSSPGLRLPHNRDCLSSVSKGCQGFRAPHGLKAVCDLATAGPSRPSNACLPTPSSRDRLHFAITPRTWLAQPSARCPGHVAPMWEQLQTSQGSHLDSVGSNEKIRTHRRRNILGGDVQQSAKFRGQMLAAGWGSPIPSAHFLSRERAAAPRARLFRAPTVGCSVDRRGLAQPASTTPSQKNCPLVANSLLVNAQAFDIRITSPSSADRAPGDAEPNDRTDEPTRAKGGVGHPIHSLGRLWHLRRVADSLSQCPGFPGFQGFGWDAVIGATAQHRPM